MLIEVNTTCGNQEEAKRIARKAIELHFCACAHIYQVESYYWWDGVVNNDNEYRLSFKTVAKKYKELVALIVSEHSYELPAVYSTVLNSTKEYANWVDANSSL